MSEHGIFFAHLDTIKAEIANKIQERKHVASNSAASSASEGEWDLEAYYRAKAEGLQEAEKIVRNWEIS